MYINSGLDTCHIWCAHITGYRPTGYTCPQFSGHHYIHNYDYV